MKRILTSIIIFLIFLIPKVFADTQGANYPGTATTALENPYDDNDWTSPTNNRLLEGVYR